MVCVQAHIAHHTSKRCALKQRKPIRSQGAGTHRSKSTIILQKKKQYFKYRGQQTKYETIIELSLTLHQYKANTHESRSISHSHMEIKHTEANSNREDVSYSQI